MVPKALGETTAENYHSYTMDLYSSSSSPPEEAEENSVTVIHVSIRNRVSIQISEISNNLDSRFKNGDLIPVFTVSWCEDGTQLDRRFNPNSLLHLRDVRGRNAVPFFLFVVVESDQLEDYRRALADSKPESGVAIICLDGNNLIPR